MFGDAVPSEDAVPSGEAEDVPAWQAPADGAESTGGAGTAPY